VRVLDAKAGFITALNLGLMADPGDIADRESCKLSGSTHDRWCLGSRPAS